MPANPRTKTGYYLEVEPDILAQFKGLAQINGRSVREEIVHALRRHLAQPPVVVVQTQPLAEATIPPPSPRKRKGKG